MTILHNHISTELRDDSNNNRTVLLHQHAGEYGGEVSFTTAHFAPNATILTRQSANDGHKPRKPRVMRLSTAELDALVTAYTQFKADCEAAKIAAQQADDAAHAAALGLARDMRDRLGDFGTVEIRKVKTETSYAENVFTVGIPELNWTYYKPYGGNHIYTGAGLYDAVKSALSRAYHHILDLESVPHDLRSGWDVNREKFEGQIAAWHEHQDFFKSLYDAKNNEDEEAETPATFTVELTNE